MFLGVAQQASVDPKFIAGGVGAFILLVIIVVVFFLQRGHGNKTNRDYNRAMEQMQHRRGDGKDGVIRDTRRGR